MRSALFVACARKSRRPALRNIWSRDDDEFLLIGTGLLVIAGLAGWRRRA
jgi:hypothetical protein